MTKTLKSTALLISAALAGAVICAPASAQTTGADDGFEEAHSLRSLEIMLMVTALRCRTGSHDFQTDYHRFSATHMQHLRAASTTLRRTFEASYGERNPARALDRMGVKIANAYGGGHPWMGCAELQQVTRELCEARDAAHLKQTARRLLSATRPPVKPAQTVAAHAEAPSPIAQGDNVQISYNMTADWQKRP